jgi:chemotaxis protein CheX
MSAALALPAHLDLVAAAPLRSEILARRGRPLDLDGAAVERLGGLCLQVLLAARATWTADDQPFRLLAPSPELREAISTLGAHDALIDCIEETNA